MLQVRLDLRAKNAAFQRLLFCKFFCLSLENRDPEGCEG